MQKDLQTVKQRIYAVLLPDKLSPARAARVRADAKSIRPDGGWPDINYRNRTRSGWPAARHLGRLQQMAVAYRVPGKPLCGDAALRANILRGIDYWLKHDFSNPNWWWNQIGVPMSLSRILILMEPHLSKQQLAAGLRIMRRSKVGMTGANLVWLAGNQIRWGCLAGDARAVQSALRAIAREIRVATGGHEGIKPDRSFWQHGRCLYSGGYGAAYSTNCARFARIAAATAFQFPATKLNILTAGILDGQQWMIRGGRFDFGVIGRQISRPGGNSSRSLIPVCRDMILAGAPRKDEFDAFLRRLEGRPGDPKLALRGNRHFWNSDLMTHHRAAYYTSARMVSARLVNTDMPCNDEGLLSHHIADGANLLMRTGEEYQDVYPVWDWQSVPGTTVEYTGGRPRGPVRSNGRGRFVGGVSDGEYGAAAMNLARGSLQARKAWFFFDNEYVCLGAGIACASGHPVRTSVNQCRLEGEVRAAGKPVGKGTHKLAGPVAVHHAGVAYVFPERADVVVRAAEQTGSWHRLRKASPKTPVALDVFSLWIEHGAKPQGDRSRYACVVAPGLAANRLAPYARSLPVTIIANTSALQAVRHKTLRITLAALRRAGTVDLGDRCAARVDVPCLLLVREMPHGIRIAVARPLAGAKTLTVTINRRVTGQGCTSVKGKPESTAIAFKLPSGDDLGRSVVRDLAFLRR